MLSNIHIRNLALIPEVDLDLQDGLTLFTGETGAGKSLFTDALGLALGDRADTSMIREGCNKAEVNLCAHIKNLPVVQDWLSQNDLENDTEGSAPEECYLRRILSKDGRSRAYINGSPVSLQQLRELGEQLVSIQGQHAHQSILKSSQQRHMLDEYAQHMDCLEAVSSDFHNWHQAHKILDELVQANAAKEERLQLLQFQYDELNALNLQDDEIVTLETEHRRLSHSNDLKSTLGDITNQLESSSDHPINPALSKMAGQLNELKKLDAHLNEPASLLEEACILLTEATHSCQSALDNLTDDPERLNALDQRLGQLYDVARKYRIKVQELAALVEKTRVEYEMLQQLDTDIEQQRNDVESYWQCYLKSAGILTKKRIKASQQLAKELIQRVQALGMETAVFEIAVEKADNATAHGFDNILWKFTANQGTTPQPLSSIASGGELSRICLAIHSAIATDTQTPTLIFDEADTGVGGKIAEFIGKLLKTLSEKHQVLCITHLPQVACYGDQHVCIAKQAVQGQTETLLQPLADNERVEELARMLGGLDITETTRAHAQEMLQTALG